MVVHPLESGVTHKRSLRSAIPSVAVHAAIVLVVVHATAHAALPTAPPPTVVDTRIFTPHATEPPRTSTTQGTHSRGSYVDPIPLRGRPFAPPIDVPDHLPVIPVDTAPIIGGRDFGEGIAHDRVARDGIGDDGGNSVLTGLEVDRQVELLPGAPAPDYPDALRAAGVRGSVLAEFVVDTTGRVEAGSFRALRSDDPLFTAAARAALLHTRFRPAESNGRRVRQLVQQSFSFVLR